MIKVIRLLNSIQELFNDGKIDREEAHAIVDWYFDLREAKK
jgi:hypothetical protein